MPAKKEPEKDSFIPGEPDTSAGTWSQKGLFIYPGEGDRCIG